MLIFKHTPVLLNEVINYLNLKKGGTYVDGTLGRGGHAEAILEKIGPNGSLIAFDRDSAAIEESKNRFKNYKNIKYIQDNFANLANYLPAKSINGILFDLGVSSPQLDNEKRGFSWLKNGPLDMRMNPQEKLTAKNIINTYSIDQLIRIFQDFGEERFAKKIAYAIDTDRKLTPFENTKQFSDFLFRVAPGKREQKKATVQRIFQAIRIEVNNELKSLEIALENSLKLLKTGGRIVVISFHSLEDRIVKHFFQKEAKACICPPDLLICQCKHSAQLKILTKKPIIASKEEMKVNPRSKSAKLRAAEKIN